MKEYWEFYINLFSNENISIRIITYSATLATLTFLINYIIKPIWSRLILKRNIIAERKIERFAKKIEANPQRDRYFSTDEISSLLNLPKDEVIEILVRAPKFKSNYSQTLWVRRKLYKPEDDIGYGEELI